MSKAQFNKRSECSGSIYTYTGGIMTYNYAPGDVLDLSQFGQFPEGATVADLDRNGDGLVTVADTGGIAMIAYNAGRLVIRFSPSNIIYLNGTPSIELACITGPSQSPIPTPEPEPEPAPTPEPEVPPSSSNETEPTPPPSPAPVYVPSPIEPPSNDTSPVPPTGSPSGEPNEPPSTPPASPPVEEPGTPEPEPEVPPSGEPNEPPSTPPTPPPVEEPGTPEPEPTPEPEVPPSTPPTPPPVEEPGVPPMEPPSSAEPPVPSPSEIPSSPPPMGEPQTPPMEPPSGGQTPMPSEEPPVSPPEPEPISPPAPVYVPSPAQPPSAGPEPVDSPEEPVPSPVPPYEPPFTPAPMEAPSNTTSPIDTPSPSTQKPEPELPQTSGSGRLEPDLFQFIPVIPLIKSANNWLGLAGKQFLRWINTPTPPVVTQETLSSYESGQTYDRAMRALSEQHAISPASAHKIVNEYGFTETVIHETDGTTSTSITLPPEAHSTVKQAQRIESMTAEQVAQVNPGFHAASFASLVLFGVAAWRHYKTEAEAQRVLSPEEVQEALVTLKKELTINKEKLARLERSNIVQTSDPQNYVAILDQQKGYLEGDKAAYRRIKKGIDVRQADICELQENIGEMRKFLAHYYTEQYETYAQRLQAERSNASPHSKRV